jgi:hypothetical protein
MSEWYGVHPPVVRETVPPAPDSQEADESDDETEPSGDTSADE